MSTSPTRRSIEIEGLSHLTAIPVATKIGSLLVSSVIAPFNPGTRDVPPSIDEQVSNIFRHVGKMLEAAETDWNAIAKMEFWVPTPGDRAALEGPWLTHFPEADSRPARHTHVGGGNVTASLLAWVGDS